MVFGAIVAGGTGQRMNRDCKISVNGELPDIPKQFLPLLNRPMIYYSVREFLRCGDKIDRIFIGVHKDYVDYMHSIADEYFCSEREKIVIVTGGADRNGTIVNIIEKAQSIYGKSGENEHFIITHDAVRPFVTRDMIERNIDAVKKYGAVDTACAAVDTVVESDGEFIDKIPSRDRLFYGQTPQSFDMVKFMRLYNALPYEKKTALTDGCKIFTESGERVFITEGDSMNMKITTKNDYFLACKIAELILD